MKRLALLCGLAAGITSVYAAQLSFLVLNTQAWQAGRLPDGWTIKVNRGKPDISTIEASGDRYLRLRSRASSYGLERSVDVDPSELPFLTWRWKVTALPAGGDFRRASTDDQAAQVLVAFSDRRVLSYIWDTTAPRGTMQNASWIPLVHIYAVVCQSGSQDLNQWITESHNLAADYEKAYGRPAPRVKGLRLQINTQHTGSEAESYFGDISFSNNPR